MFPPRKSNVKNSQHRFSNCCMISNLIYFTWNHKFAGNCMNVYSNCGLTLGIIPTSFTSNSLKNKRPCGVNTSCSSDVNLTSASSQCFSAKRREHYSYYLSETQRQSLWKHMMTPWMEMCFSLRFESSIWYQTSTEMASKFHPVSHHTVEMNTTFRNISGMLQLVLINNADFGQ